MWFGNKGFYMAELIISLSGWMVITTIFVPIYIQLHSQFVQIEEKSAALHILYEHLQQVIVEDTERENVVLSKGNQQYFIIWHDGKKEVMLRYETVSGNIVEIHERTP